MALLRRSFGCVIVVCTCALATGCGGAAAAKHAPSQQEAHSVGLAVGDIVYQCQSVAAGFVAAPNSTSLSHDVNALLSSSEHIQPNARMLLESASGPSTTTTLRRALSLAEANLRLGTCAPRQAERLQQALGH